MKYGMDPINFNVDIKAMHFMHTRPQNVAVHCTCFSLDLILNKLFKVKILAIAMDNTINCSALTHTEEKRKQVTNRKVDKKKSHFSKRDREKE